MTFVPSRSAAGAPRVVVAMSGGVDSSVAAILLAEAGYEVIGVTMRLFSTPDQAAGRLARSCCSTEDVEDARAVCRAIGARHYFLNFEREFRRHVVDYFVREYSRGRTPYPCLACNDRLKFDFLLRRAGFLNARFIATGHYARIDRTSDGRWRLRRGADRGKDQSYVLYTLGQEQLGRLLLPVGGFTKSEVRAIASDRGLVVAQKPDSQDICFIPDGDYRSFVASRLKERKPGAVVDTRGRLLRMHDGIHRFTIGQRRRLGLQGGSERRRFVTAIDPRTATVTVGPAERLLRREMYASRLNWVQGAPPVVPLRATVQVRYASRDEPAVVTPLGAQWARIELDAPQRAIAPGQAAVFFHGDEVVGGGTIELSPPAARLDATHAERFTPGAMTQGAPRRRV